MDSAVILSKCISLLYRESHIENLSENSADLVKTAIERITISDTDIGVGTRRNTLAALKTMIVEMCRNTVEHVYDLSELTQQVRLITNGDETLYQAITQGLEVDMAGPALKRAVTNLKKTISGFYRDERLGDLLKRASREFNFNRNSISDTSAYINTLVGELTALSTKSATKDMGLIKTLDLSDDESIAAAYSEVEASNSDGLAFRTGFVELDQATQGGPRPGDTMVISALQHEYKTGYSLSVFAHLPLFNRPRCTDPDKKPLCYRITAEDPVRNNAQFLYQLLKYEETGEAVDVKKCTVAEMSKYVKQRLSVNGYHVLIDEINPTRWTYQSIINRVIELESQGYKVEVLCIDYLSKIPTTGCTQGAMGDDMMDMLSRLRAFCSA